MAKPLWVSISLIAHLLLLFVFILPIHQVDQPIVMGNAKQPMLSSYLIQTTVSPTKPRTPRSRHANINLATNNTPTHTSPSQQVAVKGKEMPALITLLHTAIEHAQHYPASAEETEREGRTTLSFTLHQNGMIDDVKILHSSGTKSLDYAALSAIHTAAPFQRVDRYLKTDQTFNIDVVFTLS